MTMFLDQRIGDREYKIHVRQTDAGGWRAECMGRRLVGEGDSDHRAIENVTYALVSALRAEGSSIDWQVPA